MIGLARSSLQYRPDPKDDNALVLAVTVRTRMRADEVLEALYPLLLRHGTPEYIRSDNGPEFIAQAMQDLSLIHI